jgi:WD40 repeat protein
VTGQSLRTFVGHTRPVRSLTVGNGRIFSGGWDDTVREWDLETGQCVRVFEGAHELGINAVVVDEQHNKLYSGSDDRNIAVYDLVSGETIHVWSGMGSGSISDLVLINGGDNPETAGGFLASASTDGSVSLWDLTNGYELVETASASANEVTGLVVLGERLYSTSNDRNVYEWDVATWIQGRAFRGHTGYVSCITGTLGTGSLEVSSAPPADSSDSGNVYGGSLDPPGGPRIFTGSWDGSLKVWDLVGGHCIATIKAHNRSVNAIALGERGKIFTGSADGSIKSWDLGKFRLIFLYITFDLDSSKHCN